MVNPKGLALKVSLGVKAYSNVACRAGSTTLSNLTAVNCNKPQNPLTSDYNSQNIKSCVKRVAMFWCEQTRHTTWTSQAEKAPVFVFPASAKGPGCLLHWLCRKLAGLAFKMYSFWHVNYRSLSYFEHLSVFWISLFSSSQSCVHDWMHWINMNAQLRPVFSRKQLLNVVWPSPVAKSVNLPIRLVASTGARNEERQWGSEMSNFARIRWLQLTQNCNRDARRCALLSTAVLNVFGQCDSRKENSGASLPIRYLRSG